MSSVNSGNTKVLTLDNAGAGVIFASSLEELEAAVGALKDVEYDLNLDKSFFTRKGLGLMKQPSKDLMANVIQSAADLMKNSNLSASEVTATMISQYVTGLLLNASMQNDLDKVPNLKHVKKWEGYHSIYNSIFAANSPPRSPPQASRIQEEAEAGQRTIPLGTPYPRAETPPLTQSSIFSLGSEGYIVSERSGGYYAPERWRTGEMRNTQAKGGLSNLSPSTSMLGASLSVPPVPLDWLERDESLHYRPALGNTTPGSVPNLLPAPRPESGPRVRESPVSTPPSSVYRVIETPCDMGEVSEIETPCDVGKVNKILGALDEMLLNWKKAQSVTPSSPSSTRTVRYIPMMHTRGEGFLGMEEEEEVCDQIIEAWGKHKEALCANANHLREMEECLKERGAALDVKDHHLSEREEVLNEMEENLHKKKNLCEGLDKALEDKKTFLERKENDLEQKYIELGNLIAKNRTELEKERKALKEEKEIFRIKMREEVLAMAERLSIAVPKHTADADALVLAMAERLSIAAPKHAADAEAQTEPVKDSRAEAEAQADLPTDSKAGAGADSEAGADSKAGAEGDSEAGADSKADAADAEAKADPSADSKADAADAEAEGPVLKRSISNTAILLFATGIKSAQQLMS